MCRWRIRRSRTTWSSSWRCRRAAGRRSSDDGTSDRRFHATSSAGCVQVSRARRSRGAMSRDRDSRGGRDLEARHRLTIVGTTDMRRATNDLVGARQEQVAVRGLEAAFDVRDEPVAIDPDRGRARWTLEAIRPGVRRRSRPSARQYRRGAKAGTEIARASRDDRRGGTKAAKRETPLPSNDGSGVRDTDAWLRMAWASSKRSAARGESAPGLRGWFSRGSRERGGDGGGWDRHRRAAGLGERVESPYLRGTSGVATRKSPRKLTAGPRKSPGKSAGLATRETGARSLAPVASTIPAGMTSAVASAGAPVGEAGPARQAEPREPGKGQHEGQPREGVL